MTPPVGDAFPQDYREKFCDEKIKPGAVFRMRSEDTDPPKIKRFIILAINDELSSVALFYINSEINPNIFQTETMQKLHLPLLTSRFTFLDRDSYLDCSQLYEWTVGSIKSNFVENLNSHLGQIMDTDLEEIRITARSAPTIEQKLKRRYNLL